MTPKLPKEQAIIISAFTGILICEFSDLQEDVEKRLGRPVLTHEFADGELWNEIRALYRDDFINLAPEQTK